MGDLKDIAIGAVVQIVEALTLGMPFEVWKTQQISSLNQTRPDSAWTSFQKLSAGGPVSSFNKFYKGSSAKVVECGSKGGLLFFTSELVLDSLETIGYTRTQPWCQSFAGFFGGISQTIVMAPMTYVVTYKNSHKESTESMGTIMRNVGLRRIYGSAPALAMRQGSNWALRGLFAQYVNDGYRAITGKKKINVVEEVLCGFAGGALACINQPTEVLRVVVQSQQARGTKLNTRQAAAYVVKSHGMKGFFVGLVPRMGLSAWQTVFLVTVARRVKNALNKKPEGGANKKTKE